MNDKPVTDDVKAKFREALAKKQAQRHDGHDGTDSSSEHGKVEGVRDAKTSGSQQMFRRKSG